MRLRGELNATVCLAYVCSESCMIHLTYSISFNLGPASLAGVPKKTKPKSFLLHQNLDGDGSGKRHGLSDNCFIINSNNI